MMQLVEHLKKNTLLRWNRVYGFKPKVRLSFEFGEYLVKTVDHQSELIGCLKLRHEVFKSEYCGTTESGLDIDRYDHNFDHLVVIHKYSGNIIATYRLKCIKNASESYTAQEFELKSLLETYQNPLELGRACIHKDYRKGSTILLLWRGIAEYMNLSNADALFGCSSVKTSSTREAALIYKYLKQKGFTCDKLHSYPKSRFRMKDFDIWHSYFGNALTFYQHDEARDLIPSLLKSYLKLGAKVICEPAYDEEFLCIDLLTVIKKEDLADFLARRFQIE